MKHPKRTSRYSSAYPSAVLFVLLAVLFWSRCSVHKPLVEPSFFPRLEWPTVDSAEFVVQCLDGRFTFRYDTTLRRSVWVAHVLTRGDVESDNAERRNRFVIDPDIRDRGWPYARTSDYTRSGYDRGHLVPSADRLAAQAENDATFRMSNIAPQAPALNQGLWNSLEQQVRQLAVRFDSLWIVTGTLSRPEPLRIGAGGVAVPDAFYKVILARERDGSFRSIAFLVPNGSPGGTFGEYAASVDEVEKQSGIDFFPALPEAIEAPVEAQYNPSEWMTR
jgi:endonuclease G